LSICCLVPFAVQKIYILYKHTYIYFVQTCINTHTYVKHQN
jgi:hypothetical protein